MAEPSSWQAGGGTLVFASGSITWEQYEELIRQQIIDAGGLRADWVFLESLAGVGHKTASVVMSQVSEIPGCTVDTHMHRLAKRW
mgnify:CR=1 FL=1